MAHRLGLRLQVPRNNPHITPHHYSSRRTSSRRAACRPARGTLDLAMEDEIETTGGMVEGVYAADMDGDGDVDVLSADSRADLVAW